LIGLNVEFLALSGIAGPRSGLFVGVVHFRDRPLRGAGFFGAGFCLRALGPLPAGRTCFSAIHFSKSERRWARFL
jgi:hypothetical protein